MLINNRPDRAGHSQRGPLGDPVWMPQPQSKGLTVCEVPERDKIQELKQDQSLVILSSSYSGAVKPEITHG